MDYYPILKRAIGPLGTDMAQTRAGRPGRAPHRRPSTSTGAIIACRGSSLFARFCTVRWRGFLVRLAELLLRNL